MKIRNEVYDGLDKIYYHISETARYPILMFVATQVYAYAEYYTIRLRKI